MGLAAEILNQRLQYEWCKHFSFILPCLLMSLSCIYFTASAPPFVIRDNNLNSLHHDVWPPMQHHDIWEQKSLDINHNIYPTLEESITNIINTTIPRKTKAVIDLITPIFKQRKSKGTQKPLIIFKYILQFSQ